MKIAFSPLIPKRFQLASTLYTLIFSNNLQKIENKKTPEGFFKTTISKLSPPMKWVVETARPFQGLLIVTDNGKEWVSNLYFTGKKFKQGPWIAINTRQLKEKFVIQIDTNDEKTEVHLESNAPLFFKTKNKKQHEDEWLFPKNPKIIKGIIDTPKETHPLLTIENENGFATSINLKLNKKQALNNLETKCPKKTPKKFNAKQCIQCELNQICETVQALEKAHPWMKYIQNT